MSDPVTHLKQELLAAAERQQGHAFPARKSRRRWLDRSDVQQRGRAGASSCSPRPRSSWPSERPLRSGACAISSSTGASSVCRQRERRRARRRAASSSSIGWGLPRPFNTTPWAQTSCAPGCTPTGESSGTGGPRPRKAIPEGANEFTSGYLEQRLTPEGVDLLRSAVAGLFDRSRTLLETFSGRRSVAGLIEPLGSHRSRKFQCSLGAVEVPDGDRLIRLRLIARSALPARSPALRRHVRGHDRDAGAAFGSPAGRGAAHRPGVAAAVERVGRSRSQGLRAVALRSVHRHRAAEGCVSRSSPCCRRGPRMCSATRAGHGAAGKW